MIQLKLFVRGIIILVVVIGCPIIISAYTLNVYLLILATIMPMVSVPLALKYCVKPQIEKFRLADKKYEIAGL